MNSSENRIATVNLTIPMRAEYVSIARLTAAGVANRIGFDIEAIEDIKVSLSEVCNRIISTLDKFSKGYDAECRIEFFLSENNIGVNFYVDNSELLHFFMPDNPPRQDGLTYAGFKCGAGVNVDIEKLIGDQREEEQYKDQLQLSLISLLMDEFIINPSDGCLVSMKKYIE